MAIYLLSDRLKADLTENKIGKPVEEMLEKLEKALLWEILDTYPDIRYYESCMYIAQSPW